MAAQDDATIRTAARRPYWQDTVTRDDAPVPLAGDLDCDVAIVGGGFTGLWSALKARAEWPDARIVVLDAATCGDAASGRSGGFCAPSISHGIARALARWPRESDTLIRLGRENLDALEADLDRHGIRAEFERPGKLSLAATPWQADGLRALQAASARVGVETELLEGDALRDRLDSPRYGVGLFEPNYALVNPMRLTDGLRRAALTAGAVIHENTPVAALARDGDGVALSTGAGRVRAMRAILATNAAKPLLRRLATAIIPVYDYSLVTEPLSDAQLAAIGWTGRHGVADSGNRFHYSRKTADNRILWGGFDAIYHRGSARDAHLLDREESFATLAANFRAAFPPLADVRFSHRWGGIIDTSVRTTFFVGAAMRGRVAYAMGFTGQGVSAARFGALTMCDLLAGRETERTRLRMLRRFPVPFPPEPLRALAVSQAQRGLAAEDETGRRPALLRLMDRFGIGFDS